MTIERIEALSLGSILKNRLFDPLQMIETRMTDHEAIIANRASGYWINKTNNLINRNPTETTPTLGAGGLLPTADDLARWDNALYGKKFINVKNKKTMWTEVVIP